MVDVQAPYMVLNVHHVENTAGRGGSPASASQPEERHARFARFGGVG
jgi:hypothetical protein